MLGLGETEKKLSKPWTICALKKVDIMTIGQYLQPTLNIYQSKNL